MADTAIETSRANLLITNAGRLKIADFGLARSYNDPSVPLTKKVITLWWVYLSSSFP
jgi:serine/threonine protein kinase